MPRGKRNKTCGGCGRAVALIDRILCDDEGKHECPALEGALTTAPYRDMDDMAGVEITLHRVNNGQDITVKFGHAQATALAAAMRPGGRPVILYKDGRIATL